MTRVLVPTATSFSGSASWASRCSPGVRGSATSNLLDDFVHLVEELHRAARHNRRDRVFVDQLRVAVTAQEYAEIVEPRHDALQLHPIHKENREGNLVLTDIVEERVL